MTRRAQLAKESAARIASRAAELMVAFPEASVDECLRVSMLEEQFIYGTPGDDPIGILGRSPLEGGTR